MAPRPGATPRRSRPSYVAAPPLLSETEPFEGAAVLQEHPGALGVVLWKSLRDVMLWTQTPEDARGGIFPGESGGARREEVAAAGAGPELWGPLFVLAEMLTRPAAEQHRRVAHACRSVARWAEQQQKPATQLAFTQAAALLAPESARLAYAVGRLSRERAEYARAETWFRRAIKLGRGSDWEYYVLSYLSLGTLYQQLGNVPAARTLTLRGLRSAGRRRLRGLQGTALHNLFVLSAEAHDAPRAHEYARGALSRYGTRHPRLPALAHDVACFWSNRGLFAQAVPVLEAVLPHIPTVEERAVVLANVSRAAAGAGQRARFEARWADTVAALAASRSDERAAEAWLDLARGAALMAAWERAEKAAGRAFDIASRRRQSHVSLEAEAEREAARACRLAAAGREAAPALAQQADELVSALVTSLEGRLAAAAR